MSEVVYSTIKEDDTGKLISVSVPYDPASLSTEDDLALARAIHDDLQQRLQQWFEEEFARELGIVTDPPMSESSLTLFGFPVVITDAIPQGEILLGRLPTWQEVALFGSLEAAIEAQKGQWAKIKDVLIDDG